MFGNLKLSYTLKFKDVSFVEFAVLLPLFILIFVIGLSPSFVSELINLSTTTLFFYCFQV